ncbi:T9SS C-terminal target domain-containing protein [Pelagicoccus albus]|uniref:T9SS C-terminal target domain-containing protein n=1 Tax=Pelagicoccus albus TaxID=415222 RepID=A0A7X1E883_9BACT|nr:T9SS C-terminal target domain-containing protein [Pelagicoccus albus]MBC2605883.1 T9SS C-terminal target domain-containing protein [Pelagicoccus albus]
MKRTISILAAIASAAGIQAAVTSTSGDVVTYTGGLSEENRITEDTLWTNDFTYILDGKVYVTDGATLTIEPGTLIMAEDEQSDLASALIISRGSKIYAMGTPSNPIVFTTINDSITSVHDTSDLNDLDTGEWGGVVILGDGLLNSDKEKEGQTYPDIDDHVEGIPANEYTVFGGTSNDNSQGILRYVSIRHGGAVLDPDNELNGLTLGGVTDKTVIEFVEIFSNSDDSIEIFGGNVNPRYIVSAFSKDDSFDWDSGWEGYGQFWLSIGSATAAGNQDHGAEMDGIVFNGDNVVAEQRGMGIVYNATIVGPGSDSGVSEGLFEISDDAGVRYYNSIFSSFGASDHVIDIKDDAVDGITEIPEGDTVPRIDLQNNIWWDFAAGTDTSTWVNSLDDAGDVIFSDASHNNTVEDPMLRGISRINDGGFDPRPAADSPALTNALYAYPEGLMSVDYQGAFGTKNWLYGWTKLSIDGYLPETNEVAAARPGALSANLNVAAGANGTIDFAVYGELPSLFLIRAAGPKLADYNVTRTLMADPMITVRNFLTGEIVAEFTGWTDRADMVEALSSSVGLFSLAASDDYPTEDETSAVAIVSLNPGVYTVTISDETGNGGFVQASAFNIDL